MKVGIGTITRNRAELLNRLLNSYSEMNMPEGVEFLFIVVENLDTPTVESIVSAFQETVAPHPVIFDTEARQGIPFARNKALDIALTENCDFLTFVDDDETVSVSWLEEILKEITSRDLDLVGGPVHFERPQDFSTLSYTQRLVSRGLEIRYADKHKSALKHKTNGQFERLGIFTNNWIIRLNFCRETGLRFDESIGLAGGSDRRILDEAIQAGAKTGWAENANVYDFLPTHRLSAKYQFTRSRDQVIALNKTREKVMKTRPPRRKYLFSALLRYQRSFVYVLLFPLDPAKYFNKSVELAGIASGYLYSAMRWDTDHYA